MKLAVLAALVKRVVLPAIFICAGQLLAVLDILPKEEGLHRKDFETDGTSQVKETYLLVFVVVQPVKKRFLLRFFGFKTPGCQYFLKFVEGNVPLLVSIEFVEGLF